MNEIFQKMNTIPVLAMKHKGISAVVVFVIAAGGYYGYQKVFTNEGVVRYAFAQTQKGTLIVSISGSGQVSASDQVDIKTRTSGEVTRVYVTPGQEVAAGQLIAQVDPSVAQRSVRDAETALETAKYELDKILAPIDELTLFQAENSLDQAKKSKQKAEDNIIKALEDGFNDVSGAFLALPNVMVGLADILYGSNSALDATTQNLDYYTRGARLYDDVRAEQYRKDVENKYQIARTAYDKSFESYKSASRDSDAADIESLVKGSYAATRDIAEAVKSASNLIQFYKDKLTERNLKYATVADTHLANLNSYTGTTNSNLTNLLSALTTIKNSREDSADADKNIKERELSLVKTRNGPDELDIRAKKIVIQQREDSLATARQALADTSIRAPFAGVVAKVSAKKGDSVSSGATLSTVITKQKIAEISLNEMDVARVKPGQKVMLTFDAVSDLTISGQVVEIDALGTVSQGVVTYSVKIGFDTQDERVKTAMSVSAAVITDAKPNALMVPNSAVKSQGGVSYVEIPSGSDISLSATANATGIILSNPLSRKNVEIGASNDDFTEIVGGLSDGDSVVSRTIQPQVTQTQTTQPLRLPGVTGGSSIRGGGTFSPAR